MTSCDKILLNKYLIKLIISIHTKIFFLKKKKLLPYQEQIPYELFYCLRYDFSWNQLVHQMLLVYIVHRDTIFREIKRGKIVLVTKLLPVNGLGTMQVCQSRENMPREVANYRFCHSSTMVMHKLIK